MFYNIKLFLASQRAVINLVLNEFILRYENKYNKNKLGE
jgi:hypothetical protein